MNITLPPQKTPFARPTTRAAFTLVELLAVITIIGVLAAIILSVISRVRESARNAQCISNLRQIGVAARLYADEHKGLSSQTTGRPYFYEALWPCAYSVPIRNNTAGQNELPNNLTGTIFECPKAKDDIEPPRRSYGINNLLSPTVTITDSTGTDRKLIQVHRVEVPAKAAFFGDSLKSSGLSNQGTNQTWNERHSGKMNVCFVDGHVAAVRVTGTELETNKSHTFWTGK
ncbi:N-terminal cleavage protein [Opitutaceae bacterium TAV5]|nr:N-terminal cleavage protein [Opitutaceae bacterium TAV5]